jgi:hypothetical protein
MSITNDIDFEPYILNENNMISYLKYKFNTSSVKNITEKKCEKSEISKKSNIFSPKENDSLFWCYYIILNGETAYEMINVRNILVEKSNKFEYVNKIRSNKPIVKTYKFDTLTNIESNLANDDYISIKTIMTLCAIDKINIIFVTRKTYFELLMNDDKPIYVIRDLEIQTRYKKKYGYEIADINMLEEIRKTLYKVETLDKPIKALSYYKVQDLVEICNKLAIEIINKENGKTKTKNQLYEALIQYF